MLMIILAIFTCQVFNEPTEVMKRALELADPPQLMPFRMHIYSGFP